MGAVSDMGLNAIRTGVPAPPEECPSSQDIDIAPPPPAVDVRRPRRPRGRAFQTAQQFGGACECCLPPGEAGSEYLPTLADGTDGRAAIIAEVEREAEHMMPWERIAAIFAWKQMGDSAREEKQWLEAGTKYVRALAYARALDPDASDAKDDAAWVAGERQRQELSRLRGEVLGGMSMLHLRRAWLCVEDNAAALRERRQLYRMAVEYGRRAVHADDSSLRAHLHVAVAAAELASFLDDAPMDELVATLATGDEEEEDSDSLLELARSSKSKVLGLRDQGGALMPAELLELQHRLDAALV